MQQLKNSIAWRLTIWFLLLSLLPMGVMAVFVRRTVTDTFSDLVVSNIHDQARMLAAETSLLHDREEMQALLATIGSGDRTAFIVDSDGTYVAYPEEAKEGSSIFDDFSDEIANQFLNGDDGTIVAEETNLLIAYAPVPATGLAVVVTTDRSAVSASLSKIEGIAFRQLATSLLIISIVGGAAIWIVMGPIRQLAKAAEEIGTGHMMVDVDPTDMEGELAVLAVAFNRMAKRIRELVGGLEQRVAERSRQLETLVEVSQRLSGILELSDLMREVVNLTKETFNYYHVHIYLLDEMRETLIMVEGYGEAGAKMKQQGHNISLAVHKSLVARAAREGRIITVENVQDDLDWLPNPLLPNTHSEMAIPVQLGAEVVGVLDVQSERVGGLTKEDEIALQALANQIAIAIRNARLFAETREALDKAEELQRLYTGQAWEKYTSVKRKTNYEVRRPNLPPLEEIATPEAEAALQQKKTVNRLSNGDADDLESSSSKVERTLATPLKLGDKIIGVLGIRDENPERQWTDDEIALIEAVSEQMSLALENARLVEETRRNAWRDRVVSESTAKVWSSSEIEEVMKAAVSQLGDTLGASEVVIRLGKKDDLEQN